MNIQRIMSFTVLPVLVLSFLYLALTYDSFAGILNLPGGPPCCQVNEGTCVGGDDALTTCNSTRCEISGTCEFFEAEMCNVNEGDVGICGSADVSEVPTLSELGLITAAAVLGVVGFIVFRRKNALA